MEKGKTNVFEINSVTYEVVKSWNDLTVRQQYLCFEILNQPPVVGMDAELALVFKRIELWKAVSGMVQAGIDLWREDLVVANPKKGESLFFQELALVTTEATRFLFTDNNINGMVSMNMGLTKCPHPEFEVLKEAKKESFQERMKRIQYKKAKKVNDNTKLHAPSDGLNNLTFEELIAVFDAVEKYQVTGDELQVIETLAMLYRPAKEVVDSGLMVDADEDKRIGLGEHQAKKWVDMWRLKVPVLTRQVLWFWVCSCRDAYMKRYSHVFNPRNTEGGSDLGRKYKWAGVLMEMAGNDVTKFEKVKKVMAHDVLLQFNYLEEKRVALEKA